MHAPRWASSAAGAAAGASALPSPPPPLPLDAYPPLEVLYASHYPATPAGLLIVNKPPDLCIDGDEHPVTLLSLLGRDARLPSGPSFRWQPAHRLDFATSGVLTLGVLHDGDTAATQVLFDKRLTKKQYLALLSGHITAPPALPGLVLPDDEETVAAGGALGEEAPPPKPRGPENWHFTVLSAVKALARKVKTGGGGWGGSAEGLAVLEAAAASSWAATRKAGLAQCVAAGLPPLTHYQEPVTVAAVMAWWEGGGAATLGARPDLPAEARGALAGATSSGGPLPRNIAELYTCAVLADLLAAIGGGAALPGAAAADTPPLDASLPYTAGRWAASLALHCTRAAVLDGVRYRQERHGMKGEGSGGSGGAAPLPDVSGGGGSGGGEEGGSEGGGGEGGGGEGAGSAAPPYPLPPSVLSIPASQRLPPAALAALPKPAFHISAAIADGPPGAFHMLLGTPEHKGRPALTHLRVLAHGYWHCQDGSLRPVTKVLFSPESGRRHQLRLHALAIGHPILGDVAYAGLAADGAFPRMMLHAWKLSLGFSKLRPGRGLRHTLREDVVVATPDPFHGGGEGGQGGVSAGFAQLELAPAAEGVA